MEMNAIWDRITAGTGDGVDDCLVLQEGEVDRVICRRDAPREKIESTEEPRDRARARRHRGDHAKEGKQHGQH